TSSAFPSQTPPSIRLAPPALRSSSEAGPSPNSGCSGSLLSSELSSAASSPTCSSPLLSRQFAKNSRANRRRPGYSVRASGPFVFLHTLRLRVRRQLRSPLHLLRPRHGNHHRSHHHRTH